ncbi:annexin ANXC4 [Aspergillus fijiensis CBS 313.89]|uniref:Annexin n=1 Tax=Aspergillus fijiensis CBS 313.89 TaxID=1448319 RepID=A0A8G1VW86_9EURO|nr:Annexin [Aspergillus fijiensis CBS 313.89]RAK73998.1 Annexin [Aspergillus fijiensis CBS 313.89]
MASTSTTPRTPVRTDPSAVAAETKDQRRASSLSFLRRSKSIELLGERRPSASKSGKNIPTEAESHHQRASMLYHQPPRLPSLSPAPVLDTFGGESPRETTAAPPTQSPVPRPQSVSRSTMSTPVKPESSDPYARAESMANRGRYSYVSSAASSVNNPRRLRRRKDPTPYNVLVVGAGNSGKTSFLKFLRKSLELPSKHSNRQPSGLEDQEGLSTTGEGYTSSYLETEIDGERVGLTFWDSPGLEKNIVDIQLRGVTGFLESKFEETLREETKVIRSPNARDTHIHCTFLILDPVRLDQNIAAAERAAQGTPRSTDSTIIGILDERLDVQVLRTMVGKTTVVPVISKADTITAGHMAYLRKAVWESLKKVNIDPLEILTLEDQEEYTSSESGDEEESGDDEGISRSSAPSEPSQNAPEPQTVPQLLPFTTLSPDPYSLKSGDEPIGRKFAWGFADPYNPEHCDFLKLKEAVFNDWRIELREASRVVWYERWRTSRLNRHVATSPAPSKDLAQKKVGDPRSRGRSKSPGGRIRDRSKSRDSRQPPTLDRTYLSSAPADGKLRTRSRSRGAAPGDFIRSNHRYGPSDSRDPYLGIEHGRDYYYQSDSGESKGAKRDSRYSSSAHRRDARYESYSENSYSDSEDDALAYGDLPDDDLERSYYGYKGTGRAASPRHGGAMMSGALNPGAPPAGASSRSGDGIKERVPGSHPSYARPDPFKYAAQSQHPHAQPSHYGDPLASSTVPSTWAPIPECERPGFVPPLPQRPNQAMPGAYPAGSTQPEMPAATTAAPMPTYRYVDPSSTQNPYAPQNGRPLSVSAANTYAAGVGSSAHQRSASSDAAIKPSYAAPTPFQYAQVDPNVKYSTKSAAQNATKPVTYSAAPQYSKSGGAQANDSPYSGVKYTAAPQLPKTPTSRQESGPQYVEIAPGNRNAGRPHSHSVSSAHNLTVAGPDPTQRPASPLQEPYKGTYQSISPMPSPIVISSRYDDDISDLELVGTSSDEGKREHRRKKSKDERELKPDRVRRESSRVRHERHGSTGPDALVMITPSSSRKRVTFYDAGPDALALQQALSHTRHVDNKTLIKVLPHLTSDEILDLRKEYKKHVKVHGKGVNLAKHVRLNLGNSAFGKVCYATALGRWESEAYWANCYYQSSTSRRELLIESLFGRTNGEISEIKECFRDSRYSDSLEKCMKAELKADKFRLAVLLALEETRQNERDPLDPELIERDVHELHRALISRHGGETAMIYIIVRRSDPHLREVLRAYEKVYQRNFARAMMEKSQNLVGETLAHILNGAINRPMRDALLLHQALRESRTGKERSELLISRLVRLHWEPRHLEKVKNEFRQRYRERLEDAIAEEVLTSSGGSEWGEFCIELARSSKTLVGRG